MTSVKNIVRFRIQYILKFKEECSTLWWISHKYTEKKIWIRFITFHTQHHKLSLHSISKAKDLLHFNYSSLGTKFANYIKFKVRATNIYKDDSSYLVVDETSSFAATTSFHTDEHMHKLTTKSSSSDPTSNGQTTGSGYTAGKTTPDHSTSDGLQITLSLSIVKSQRHPSS